MALTAAGALRAFSTRVGRGEGGGSLAGGGQLGRGGKEHVVGPRVAKGVGKGQLGGGGGQLGRGDTEHVVVPRVAKGVGKGGRGMAADMFHSLVGTGEGRVMACGKE